MSPAVHANGVWAETLVDELARAGLRHAVIAPGSRSTPLVLALAAHPDVADRSVIDERAAAFFALGLARATGDPAAVVTTSGTAAANLLPAVAEAERAGVPLLLLTADRPPELRDTGDSQSIDQVKLFGGFVRWFHQVAEPSLDAGRLAYLRSTACEAWARATGAAGGGPPGPVHLNLPFRKPLEPASDGPAEAEPKNGSAEAEEGGRGNPDVNRGSWRRTSAPTGEPDPAAVEELALALANARRPLVLAGALTLADPDPLRNAVRRLLAALPLPIWAEATSNLRGVPGVIATADLLLGSARFRRDLRPERIDLVLRLGAAPLGWPLRRLSALLDGADTWTVDRWGRRYDPGHTAARTLAADPARTLDAVAAWLERNAPAGGDRAGERREWLTLHRSADRASREALAEAARTGDGELFDGGVFPRLARRLPEDAALVVSSSMPLRELEAFFPGPIADAGPAGPVDVFVNRGANGIDGVTSTAAGISEGRRVGTGERAESRTVLVTGDVAFAHDLSGALAAGRPSGQGPGIRSSSDLTVVLIDNGGGAIFDHLPLARLPEHAAAFERHFTTPPGVDFGAVARGLGWSYAAADASGGWPAFDRALDQALATRGGPPRLLHVTTDRERAKALREELAARVAETVDRALESADPLDAVRPEGRRALAEPPAEEAPPILLLHGFTGSGSTDAGTLAPLAQRLAAAGHRVVTVDLPGHGTAPALPPDAGGATLDAAVAAALAALDRRGIDRAAWVGYSMGGRVALAAALAHPERVAALALLSASAGIEDDAERAARRASDEELARSLETQGLAAFVDRWMAHPLFATQERLGHRHLRRARAERMAGSARGYAASLRGMGQGNRSRWGQSLWGRLGEVRARTLLVAGGEDEKYVEIVRRMAEALPSARMEIVPGAGHAVHVEAPEPVARAILERIAASEGE